MEPQREGINQFVYLPLTLAFFVVDPSGFSTFGVSMKYNMHAMLHHGILHVIQHGVLQPPPP